MINAIIAVLLILASTNTMAAKIYKCKNSKGQVVYQSNKCAADQTKDKELNIYVPKSQPAANNYYRENRYQRNYNRDIDRILEDHDIRQREIAEKYNREIERIDRQHCQWYKDRLANIEEEWEVTKRQGYNQGQKNRYKLDVLDAKRDIQRECN